MKRHSFARSAPRLTTAFAVVGVALVLLVTVDLLWPWFVSRSGSSRWAWNASAVLVVAGLGTLLWQRLGPLYRLLISIPFAVALLTTLMLLTVVGTFVLQGGHPQEYELRYGTLPAALILALGVDDLFHTSWFNGVLAFLTVSLLLVGTRRAVWRVNMAGHMLCHLGIVVILVGGVLGNLFGSRGMIDLHEGQSASDVALTRRGVPTGERRPLGFSLRLDDFEIERYEPEYRLYAYEPKGDSYRIAASFGLDEAAEWTELEDGAVEFRILGSFPDFHVLSELRLADDGVPALRGEIVEGDGVIGFQLLAGTPERDRAMVDEEGTVLTLAASPPATEEVSRRAQATPPRHVVTHRDDAAGSAAEIEVRPGESYLLASGHRMRVLEFLPDFIYDTQQKRGDTRSEEPNNPALRVAITSPGVEEETERWLFMLMPEFEGTHGEGAARLQLAYRHDPGSRPIPREVLVVAESREAWLLVEGEVIQQGPIAESGELPGLPGLRYELFDSAVEIEEPTSRSDEWLNPVVELEVRTDRESLHRFLPALHASPLRLPGKRTILAFERKPNDVRAYRSRLAVVADGQVLREKTIEVNDPLSHGGFLFYQSNYREEDPTYSGILVVEDPGFELVFVGFLMISVGMIFIYYVRPRLLHRGV